VNTVTEGAAAADFTFGWRLGFHLQAGDASQFPSRLFHYHAEALAQQTGISFGEIPRCLDAHIRQMRLQSATDSPDLTNSHDLQQAITPMRLPYIYHPTSLSLPAFCCSIGEFGERLSGGDTYTDRDTSLLQYIRSHVVSKLEQRFRQAGQVSKRLIDIKERRTAMDMTSAQTFRYSISDVGCP
jgi:hypothetical protein|tara:strand:+ start:118 stop:669 length:552 start_codon:yes stop_codon:yes gene_type:complete